MVAEPFKFIGGALCLDFVNTVGAWVDGEPLRDKFANADDLTRWAEMTNIVGRRTSMTSPILRRAVVLRRVLYRIFAAVVEKRTPVQRDMDIFNRELAVTRSQECLGYTDGGFCLQFRESPERLLWTVVRSAAELLTSENLARLRQCPGEECAWLFLDTSRNGMRQWCQMRACGNRAKARKFRERSRAEKKM